MHAAAIQIADVLRRIAGVDSNEPCLIVAGRYGGEEFALIVPEDAPGAYADSIPMAERVRSEIAAILDDDRSVTVSVGVAGFPRDGRTASEMMSAPDAALVRAGSEGGNRVVVGRPAPDPE